MVQRSLALPASGRPTCKLVQQASRSQRFVTQRHAAAFNRTKTFVQSSSSTTLSGGSNTSTALTLVRPTSKSNATADISSSENSFAVAADEEVDDISQAIQTASSWQQLRHLYQQDGFRIDRGHLYGMVLAMPACVDDGEMQDEQLRLEMQAFARNLLRGTQMNLGQFPSLQLADLLNSFLSIGVLPPPDWLAQVERESIREMARVLAVDPANIRDDPDLMPPRRETPCVQQLPDGLQPEGWEGSEGYVQRALTYPRLRLLPLASGFARALHMPGKQWRTMLAGISPTTQSPAYSSAFAQAVLALQRRDYLASVADGSGLPDMDAAFDAAAMETDMQCVDALTATELVTLCQALTLWAIVADEKWIGQLLDATFIRLKLRQFDTEGQATLAATLIVSGVRPPLPWLQEYAAALDLTDASPDQLLTITNAFLTFGFKPEGNSAWVGKALNAVAAWYSGAPLASDGDLLGANNPVIVAEFADITAGGLAMTSGQSEGQARRQAEAQSRLQEARLTEMSDTLPLLLYNLSIIPLGQPAPSANDDGSDAAVLPAPAVEKDVETEVLDVQGVAAVTAIAEAVRQKLLATRRTVANSDAAPPAFAASWSGAAGSKNSSSSSNTSPANQASVGSGDDQSDKERISAGGLVRLLVAMIQFGGEPSEEWLDTWAQELLPSIGRLPLLEALVLLSVIQEGDCAIPLEVEQALLAHALQRADVALSAAGSQAAQSGSDAVASLPPPSAAGSSSGGGPLDSPLDVPQLLLVLAVIGGLEEPMPAPLMQPLLRLVAELRNELDLEGLLTTFAAFPRIERTSSTQPTDNSSSGATAATAHSTSDAQQTSKLAAKLSVKLLDHLQALGGCSSMRQVATVAAGLGALGAPTTAFARVEKMVLQVKPPAAAAAGVAATSTGAATSGEVVIGQVVEEEGEEAEEEEEQSAAAVANSWAMTLQAFAAAGHRPGLGWWAAFHSNTMQHLAGLHGDQLALLLRCYTSAGGPAASPSASTDARLWYAQWSNAMSTYLRALEKEASAQIQQGSTGRANLSSSDDGSGEASSSAGTAAALEDAASAASSDAASSMEAGELAEVQVALRLLMLVQDLLQQCNISGLPLPAGTCVSLQSSSARALSHLMLEAGSHGSAPAAEIDSGSSDRRSSSSSNSGSSSSSAQPAGSSGTSPDSSGKMMSSRAALLADPGVGRLALQLSTAMLQLMHINSIPASIGMLAASQRIIKSHATAATFGELSTFLMVSAGSRRPLPLPLLSALLQQASDLLMQERKPPVAPEDNISIQQVVGLLSACSLLGVKASEHPGPMQVLIGGLEPRLPLLDGNTAAELLRALLLLEAIPADPDGFLSRLEKALVAGLQVGPTGPSGPPAAGAAAVDSNASAVPASLDGPQIAALIKALVVWEVLPPPLLATGLSSALQRLPADDLETMVAGLDLFASNDLKMLPGDIEAVLVPITKAATNKKLDSRLLPRLAAALNSLEVIISAPLNKLLVEQSYRSFQQYNTAEACALLLALAPVPHSWLHRFELITGADGAGLEELPPALLSLVLAAAAQSAATPAPEPEAGASPLVRGGGGPRPGVSGSTEISPDWLQALWTALETQADSFDALDAMRLLMSCRQTSWTPPPRLLQLILDAAVLNHAQNPDPELLGELILAASSEFDFVPSAEWLHSARGALGADVRELSPQLQGELGRVFAQAGV